MKAGRSIRDFFMGDTGPAAIILVFFAVGVAGHSLRPEWMILLTPPVLWFWGILVAARAVAGEAPVGDGSKFRGKRVRLIAWIILTYAATFALEAVGTATGLVFGPYTYGDVLGLMLFSVPLVIGFNWVLVVLGGLSITERFSTLVAALTTGMITTVFDFLMEPLAVHLGYWEWHWDGIPPQNYLAWFVTSFLAALAYRSLGIQMKTRLPAFYLGVQTLFFLALRLLLRV